eukprot:7650338-Karenia_brevis.AAC.1
MIPLAASSVTSSPGKRLRAKTQASGAHPKSLGELIASLDDVEESDYASPNVGPGPYKCAHRAVLFLYPGQEKFKKYAQALVQGPVTLNDIMRNTVGLHMQRLDMSVGQLEAGKYLLSQSARSADFVHLIALIIEENTCVVYDETLDRP